MKNILLDKTCNFCKKLRYDRRMKTFLSFLIFIVFLFSFALTAQNLIPDPSFEMMQKTPSKDDNGIRCTNSWVNAVLTGGDYYNSVAKSKLLGVGAPRNIFGYQQPHSGNGYAGICIQKDMMEYVETKLTSPLKKGQKYLIEFYITSCGRIWSFIYN